MLVNQSLNVGFGFHTLVFCAFIQVRFGYFGLAKAYGLFFLFV